MAFHGKLATAAGLANPLTFLPTAAASIYDVASGRGFGQTATDIMQAGGGTEMFGLTEEQLAEQAATQREAYQAFLADRYRTQLGQAARQQAGSGFGESGGVAQAATGLHQANALTALQQESMIIQQANAARNQRIFVDTPSYFEQLLPAAGAIAGSVIGGPTGGAVGGALGQGVASPGAAGRVAGQGPQAAAPSAIQPFGVPPGAPLSAYPPGAFYGQQAQRRPTVPTSRFPDLV